MQSQQQGTRAPVVLLLQQHLVFSASLTCSHPDRHEVTPHCGSDVRFPGRFLLTALGLLLSPIAYQVTTRSSRAPVRWWPCTGAVTRTASRSDPRLSSAPASRGRWPARRGLSLLVSKVRPSWPVSLTLEKALTLPSVFQLCCLCDAEGMRRLLGQCHSRRGHTWNSTCFLTGEVGW